ncbi:hypothetical protein NW768_011194 [Fusarium equiseti]|uniref:Uncharacterized protein n=1 Tax=Fusarium equiseti TaxID=61235 RepID=A0ABQ8QXP0_FUSEQ|nr:hypothetical protein NW768_011194 [Fusarium equiseti]
MSSRHVPTRRLKSGVLFSAPDDILRVPPDESTRRPKKKRFNNIRKMIPGVRKKGVGEEMASLDASPALGHQESIAMFAKFVDPSSYGSSNHPKNPPVSSQEKETLCLPVLKVSSTATVEGTLAHMVLKQSFHNPSQMTIKEARHTFPLYDGAVVTAFECTIGDERRIRGLVKPKEEARKEYKEAIRDQTKAAALLEEHTPEIFETSLGNIPAMTTVEIKIVYIQELNVVMMEGEVSEGIALIIPTSIAPCYSKPKSVGKLPEELPHDKLDIEIQILNDGHINPDGCLEESGHLVDYHGAKKMESPQRLNGQHPVNEYYFWEHHSESPVLKKDFVFVVPMQKGHEVQSRAVLSQPDESGLAAMMVSIRPNELFRNAIIPQSFTGEILFLLDQSGSMDGWVGNDEASSDDSSFGSIRPQSRSSFRKIDVLREAMQLVLAGLPKTCFFNIISWGSETWAMWEQSRQHSPENLSEAKEYISEIMADMGGTDLLRALKSTVQRRRDDGKSTQIVVLTDGELDPEEPMEFVWKTRQELQENVRFFALGIGDDVPRSLIESIAELGGGFGDVVDTAQNPRWHARLNRLTRSALEPDTWDCDINIGDGFQQKSLIDYKPNGDTSEAQLIPYFQAPSNIAGLHPFRFTSIFFLIDVKNNEALPSEVTITTTTHGAKKKMYRVPVQSAAFQDGTMHQLAAKATLMDLEDLVKQQPSSTRLAEENAQSIGTRYSITSKWTSFVAVPEDEPANAQGSLMEHYKAMFDGIDITELLNTESEDESEHGSDMFPHDYHKITPGNAAYADNSASLGTAFPPSDDDPILTEWTGAESPRFRFERTNLPVWATGLKGSDVQVGDHPSTAQGESLGQPPTAKAGPWSSTSELDRETTLIEYNPKGSENVASDEVLPTYSSNDGKHAEHVMIPGGTTRVYNGDSMAMDEGFEWVRKKSRPPRSKPDHDDPLREYLAEYRTSTMVMEPKREPVVDGCLPEPSGPSILNGFDSSDCGSTETDSVRHDTSEAMDPLDWEIAVKHQNGQGLFELPEEARSILHLHFCPKTRFELAIRLSKILHDQGLEESLCIQIIDSMMVVRCYQTHLAATEDIWDLMMERAQDAIAEVIGQDTLLLFEEILNDSMIHQHYKAATGVGEQDEGSIGEATCPVCHIQWQTSRAFFCPFDHDSGTSHAFKEWDGFWKHQQEDGHMVCPREGD